MIIGPKYIHKYVKKVSLTHSHKHSLIGNLFLDSYPHSHTRNNNAKIKKPTKIKG